jgi:CNT family concentrative nucleoside transporter
MVNFTDDPPGGANFFWRDFIENGYFFTNTLSAIIFFVAFATLLSYIGALTWFVQKFAWFFSKTFGISGAEAVVAAGESRQILHQTPKLIPPSLPLHRPG